jgi:integrase
MSESVKVSVVEFSDRRYFQLQWRDPLTGRKRTKSSGVENTGRKRERTEAERRAAQLEADLRDNRYREPSKVTWDEFRDRYDAEVLPGLASATGQKVDAVFNTLERILSPTRLRDLTAGRLSKYAAQLRQEGRAETTIASYLAHLGAALRWAVRVKMLAEVPAIPKPHRASRGEMAKGRPVTGEELDRMLAAVPGVLESRTRGKKRLPPEPAAVDSWQRFIRGLWWSGLRLSEALYLSWDDPDGLRVDFSGRFPMLRIPAELEKGNRDRLLPIAPEFAAFLEATPEAERVGRVFKLHPRRGEARKLDWQYVSAVVSRIGKAARVVVKTSTKPDPQTGKPRKVVKHASAHDLRRSFGERWAARVMPAVLQQLMRHESIETTMRYYVGRNAETAAQAVWDGFQAASGNTLGNTAGFPPSSGERRENANAYPENG